MDICRSNCILGLPGHTRRTARFLARALGISYINHPNRQHYSFAIRWGNSERGLSVDTEINARGNILNAANKLRALCLMFKAGVSVPEFLRLPEDLSEERMAALLPGFIRAKYHRAGYSLEYCEDYHDFSNKMSGIDFSPDYIIQEILKAREYRVHVGKVGDIELLYVQRKLREREVSDHKVWNYEGGWRYHSRPLHGVNNKIIQEAQRAIEALGLHFGAVDIIQDPNGKAWVIEVNTAPGLCPETTQIRDVLTPSQEVYIKFFRGVLDNA